MAKTTETEPEEKENKVTKAAGTGTDIGKGETI